VYDKAWRLMVPENLMGLTEKGADEDADV
jgi:hypothetical protein